MVVFFTQGEGRHYRLDSSRKRGFLGLSQSQVFTCARMFGRSQILCSNMDISAEKMVAHLREHHGFTQEDVLACVSEAAPKE